MSLMLYLYPRFDHLVVPAALFRVTVPSIATDSVQAQNAHSLFEFRGGCCYHAPFTGRQVLCRIEAERNRVTRAGSDSTALVRGAGGVGRILHNFKAVLSCQPPNGIHIASQTC